MSQSFQPSQWSYQQSYGPPQPSGAQSAADAISAAGQIVSVAAPMVAGFRARRQAKKAGKKKKGHKAKAQAQLPEPVAPAPVAAAATPKPWKKYLLYGAGILALGVIAYMLVSKGKKEKSGDRLKRAISVSKPLTLRANGREEHEEEEDDSELESLVNESSEEDDAEDERSESDDDDYDFSWVSKGSKSKASKGSKR